MTYRQLLEDRAYAMEMDDKVREDYPDHAGEARRFMNRVIRRKAPHKWLVFNGQACDHKMELGELATTHRYIASLLECRDRGQPVTDLYLTTTIHACLGLGFVVIEGGGTG